MGMNIPELLRFAGPDHAKILKAILARWEMSKGDMSKRHSAWIRAEEDFRAYTPESQDDARRKSERSSGILHYTTITVPMTYAMALTAHTYWTSIFLNRTPIMQLGTRKGNVEEGVQGMEALLDYQIHAGGMLAPMFVWLLDPAKYGFGVLGTFWETKTKRVAGLVEQSVLDPDTGQPIPDRTEINKVVQEIPGYKGNGAYNIRPYDWFPDTRVAIEKFQEGEFCADVAYRGFQSLLKDEGRFNMEVLKDVRSSAQGQENRSPGSAQIQLPSVGATIDGSSVDIADRGQVHIIRMVVELIPEDWNLGDEHLPEKWAFEIADERVIISAEPFGHIHDEFPYNALFYEVDGYALDIRGMMEIGKDMNSAASWELNSHMFNVRKALNDQLLADPSRIMIKDITDGGPGGVIRVKPLAYGQDVRTMVSQLQVTDITRQSIGDMQIIQSILQQVLGVNDNVMGQVNPGGRKTATEIRSSTTFSISRLKTVAEHFSATGFTPLAQQMIQNIQQFYFLGTDPNAEEEIFQIIGEQAEGLTQVKITPETIAGFYDFIPVDGTLPIDRFAQAGVLKELMLGMLQLKVQADYPGMLNEIGALTGIKGLKRFNIQVAPDGEVADQVKRGNITPVGGQ